MNGFWLIEDLKSESVQQALVEYDIAFWEIGSPTETICLSIFLMVGICGPARDINAFVFGIDSPRLGQKIANCERSVEIE